ncbi:Sua5/YciO/YrdC/YwlC family tRNA threonylcarbamoyl adenosine modification protein [Kwoniella dendrophila CBS 6074]|uniref:Threonylcarbamoyl-AMP synthase n=1 Tax=Kwoniella dendrophila CBS 6074 TaxID=1295534 RepID=A0AAX4JWW5_9TREE
MASNTPILPCLDFNSIQIAPSSSSSTPLDSPNFDIPPSILPHLETASKHLHNHETVAVPTETVYGLAASSLSQQGLKSIYRIKNRPSDNPLIIHVSSLDMLRKVIPENYEISELYMELINEFWPGPISLLFPSRNSSINNNTSLKTNAIRMPSHKLALALIHHSNLPLSAPSANSSGRPSPTKAEHVYNDLNGSTGLGCILDGGDCGVGVESTVINGLEWIKNGGGRIDILRPGGLGIEQIQEIVEKVDGKKGLTEILLHGKPWKPYPQMPDGSTSDSNGYQQSTKVKSNGTANPLAEKIKPIDLPPSTPGLKYRHYSPKVPVYLLQPNTIFPRPINLPEEAESSTQAILRQISQRIPTNEKGKQKIGVLHYENSPLSSQLVHCVKERDDIQLVPISLGLDSASAAQRLFAGMLTLERIPPENQMEKTGVDAILIEGCSDEGLGLAVMERVSKAVGGGGILGDVRTGEGEVSNNAAKESNTFWVNVTSTL